MLRFVFWGVLLLALVGGCSRSVSKDAIPSKALPGPTGDPKAAG